MKQFSAPRIVVFLLAGVLALALLAGDAVAAPPPVGLGAASSYAVIAGQTVTNTGPSAISGDLGVAPGTAVAGLLAVIGTINAGNAAAELAQADLAAAYGDAAGRAAPVQVTELGGLALTAGVYGSGSSLGLTGTLTLDARGDPNAVFIFQAASTLITADASRLRLINGAQPCNVFWQVGSSATLGATSGFAGNIMALTSISMRDGVVLEGRALARNGSVTLINDTIAAAHCAGGTIGGAELSLAARLVGSDAPVLGQSVSLEERSGAVQVKVPGAPSYVPLTAPASVPVGSLINTRKGSVTLRSALPGGKQQSAIFHGGLFEVRQPRNGRGVTELVLRGALPTCTRPGAGARAATLSKRRKASRRLWGRDNHGQFRTRGSNSVASVRGTRWYVEDRCDGTLTRVSAGSVSVYDSRRHRSVLVRAGQSYLAR